MPLLNGPTEMAAATLGRSSLKGPAHLFPVCSNAKCTSGWLHMWRSRSAPRIEGAWACSPDCVRTRIEAMIRRELEGRSRVPETHRHRIPIGLILLAEGWITHEQLKRALEAQRIGGAGRIGAWLMEHCGLDERHLTQALGIQWNCPVFALSRRRTAMANILLPRLLLEAFGVVPLRVSGEGILYIAFEDRIDHSVVLAIERMSGLTVEAGILSGSEFRLSQRAILTAAFPKTRLIEAGSVESLASALTRLIEREKPAESRLVRVHDLFWLRFWRRADSSGSKEADPSWAEDVICSLDRLHDRSWS